MSYRPHPVRNIAASLAILGALLVGSTSAFAFETVAPTALLLDAATGTVLFEKDADRQVPPASLAKLMTVTVLFDEIKDGRLALGDSFTVSEKAWREGGASSGGSTMFLPLNSQATLDDLLKGIIIQSGNDATIVVAEGVAGSVEGFAEMMNREASELGLANSHFTNPHGLPDPAQHVTMRDLALLAENIINEHATFYPLFSETEYTFNGITQRSRNPLLAAGADGLKTGHTQEAGFGLVASMQRDGRRVILAMSGLNSAQERADEARKLMDYGFRGFERIVLLPQNQPVGEVSVTGGVVPAVPVQSAVEIAILGPRGQAGAFETRIAQGGAIVAPVVAGQEAGMLEVVRDGAVIERHPLVTAAAVEQASIFRRLWDQAVAAIW